MHPPVAVHAVREGEGQPALVFTHRMAGSSALWHPQAETLRHHFTVLRWDLPGHGLSPLPRDPEAYTREAVLAHLDTLTAGLGRPLVLVGHSIGGYHTLAWALTRPGRADGVVLLGAGIGFRRPDARARYNAVMERSAAAFGVPPRVTRLAVVPDDLVIDGLPTLDVPVLALVGRDDHARFHKAAAYLAANASQAVYRQVPGGHEAQLEHPAAVTTAIEAFAGAITPNAKLRRR